MRIEPFSLDLLTEQPETSLLTIQYHDEQQRPFILICPGGGYSHLAFQKEGSDIQEWLQQSGFHTGLLAYQVKNIDSNQLLNELEDTMSYLKKQDKISQIFVLGFSAGAHVAGLFGTKIKQKPDGLLLCYPVVSFIEAYSHQGSWQNLLGENADKVQRENFSIEKNIQDSTPPCFIWHTAEDQAVPMNNSLILAQALQEKSIPVELHIFPHGPHGLGILPDFPAVLQWKNLANTWIQSLLITEVKNNG